jgi:hypothetical protein
VVADVVDIGGKFIANVVDTGRTLSPVSLKLLINIHSRISLQIFEKG